MGKHGTTSTYGAFKSFFMQLGMQRLIQPPQLVDGKGNKQRVRTVALTEGIKHLGVQQAQGQAWSTTLEGIWEKTK